MEVFDPHAYERIAEQMCREAGISLFLGTQAHILGEPDGSVHISLANQEVRAATVVDSSGDAGFAKALGAPTRIETGRLMPLWPQSRVVMWVPCRIPQSARNCCAAAQFSTSWYLHVPAP